MKKSVSVMLVSFAIVAAVASAGEAAPRGHEGMVGPHAAPFRGPFPGHRAFVPPHRFEGRVFPGHPRFSHGRVFFGVAPFIAAPLVVPYVYPPAVATYPEAPAGYWYYCQSAGAYYPNVQACPEDWVPVPAQ